MITHEGQVKGAAANRSKAEARSRWVLARLADGATHAELADDLGVNVTSVKTIVSRSRERLGNSTGPHLHFSVETGGNDG